ncbi:DUF4231 domain-containing protein [Enterococcus faecalis]|uniref:DUF4231 domain-containing protein n=1 Tax=Enterococcus faecalis TaxID=1351 RepID=UPI00067DF4D7|nr:DUF4231 domain-containing protein [Enterococcus faecalis]
MERLRLDDYLVNRVDRYLKYLKKKSTRMMAFRRMGNITRIFLAAVIPVLIDQGRENSDLLVVVSIFAAMIAILQGIDNFFDISDRQGNIIQTIQKIEKERYLLITRASPYNKSDSEAFSLFVVNIEGVIDDSYVNFISYFD